MYCRVLNITNPLLNQMYCLLLPIYWESTQSHPKDLYLEDTTEEIICVIHLVLLADPQLVSIKSLFEVEQHLNVGLGCVT